MPITSFHNNNIKDIRKRLTLAKRRAVYWSGRPDPTGFGFKPNSKRRDSDADMQYELAMADVESLQRSLEQATGKKQKPYDPQKEYKDQYSAFLGQVFRKP